MPNALDVNRMQRSLALPGTEWGPEQSPTFTAFTKVWQDALDAGNTAAANIYRNNLRRKLARGYHGGHFVTGESERKVSVGRPRTSRKDGNRFVSVYGRHWIQRLWEFGHYNPFLRRFVRVEYWRETAMDSGERMAQAFHRAFDAALRRGS